MSFLTNSNYSALSMNGVIEISDGAGTVISNGQIQSNNIITSSSTITGSLRIEGSEISSSPTTGTLVVESNTGIGGGIGTTGNINVGKSLFLNDTSQSVVTQNIQEINSTVGIDLFTSSNNLHGISLGDANTPLNVYSPTNFINGTNIVINTQNIDAQTVTCSQYSASLTECVNNDFAVGGSIACNGIVSSGNVQCNQLLLNGFQIVNLPSGLPTTSTKGIVCFLPIQVNSEGKTFYLPLYDI